jgi:serum/glucocorticoid-regulated kinase 2
MRRTTLDKKLHKVEFEDFNLLMVLGRGAFGKVFLAELPINNQLYAIKSIRKDVLIEMNQIESTLLEKDIMFECDHPFLVGMEFLYQNELRLYFVMPFIRGGELYKIYEQQKRFNEETVRFYGNRIPAFQGHSTQRLEARKHSS